MSKPMNLFPSVKIGNVLYRASQAVQLADAMSQFHGISDLAATVAVANNTSISSEKKVQFHLDQPGHVSRMFLKIECEETGGANAVVFKRSVADLIERADIIGADNRVIQSLSADEIFLAANLNKGYDEYIRETAGSAVVAGYAASWGDLTLAASATDTYFIELPFFAGQAHVDLSNSGCRLEVYLKQNNTTGTGVLAVNSVKLFVQANRLKPEHEEHYKRNVLGAGQHCYKYAECRNVLSEPVTLTSGGTFKYRLSSATKRAVALIMAIRPSAVKTGANSGDYQAVASLQLEDNSGRVLGQTMSADELRLTDSVQGYYFSVEPQVYVIKFGDVAEAFDGKEIGGHDFSGSEYIQFVNGTSTGSHIVDVWAVEVNEVYQGPSGRISAKRQ